MLPDREGWIKLHRKMLDNQTLQDPLTRFVFIEVLLRATHRGYLIERKNHKLFLMPGELLISVRSFSEALGIGRQQLRRILDRLEHGDGQPTLTAKSNPLGTLVTVCNWASYQNLSTEANPPQTENPTHPINKNVFRKQERFGSGARARSNRHASSQTQPDSTQPEKFSMGSDWQITTAASDRLEAEFMAELGVEAFWRQVARFIEHHAEKKTVDTQDGFERSLGNWLARHNANRG